MRSISTRQDRCDYDSMYTVDADRVDALASAGRFRVRPQSCVPAQTGNGASRFNAPKDILPAQMLVLNRNRGLAVNPRSTKLLERYRRLSLTSRLVRQCSIPSIQS